MLPFSIFPCVTVRTVPFLITTSVGGAGLVEDCGGAAESCAIAIATDSSTIAAIGRLRFGSNASGIFELSPSAKGIKEPAILAFAKVKLRMSAPRQEASPQRHTVPENYACPL